MSSLKTHKWLNLTIFQHSQWRSQKMIFITFLSLTKKCERMLEEVEIRTHTSILLKDTCWVLSRSSWTSSNNWLFFERPLLILLDKQLLRPETLLKRTKRRWWKIGIRDHLGISVIERSRKVMICMDSYLYITILRFQMIC